MHPRPVIFTLWNFR